MPTVDYGQRRAQIEHYFDRTAADAWARLTSDEPVGGIRQTVREGRERMRNLLLERLPADLSGSRLLDAGCGTGMLAIEAANRGAEVVAVDLSPTLVALAAERLAVNPGAGKVTFLVGDMRELDLGSFDHAVAMDSLIHYAVNDGITTLARLAASVRGSILFTFAPRTPVLGTMHAIGRLFPRSNRAPSLEPVLPSALWHRLAQEPDLAHWQVTHSERVSSGFYTSQAVELTRR